MIRRKQKKFNLANAKVEVAPSEPLSFDQFFSLLLRRNLSHPHHKAPLRDFFKENNTLIATEEEFLALFQSY